MSAVVAGLTCTRCGGQLRGVDDPERLHCAYCDTSHLLVSAGGDVAAFAPAGRIGRRRAHRAVGDALKARGVTGFAVEDARLAWLPFWHIRGKLVGWQVYRQVLEKRITSTGPSGETNVTPLRHEERTEELVARGVDVTLPACDTRDWGLVGVADRLHAARLRPFAYAREADRALVCSVVVPRATALHQAEALRASGVAPRNAVGLKQRLSLARVAMRLVYYPVWKLHVTVDGVPAEVDVDGVRGNVIRGTVMREVPSRALGWWGSAAAAGWVAGLHPALGVLGLSAWVTDRLRNGGPHARAGLLRWMSEELAPVRARRIELDD